MAFVLVKKKRPFEVPSLPVIEKPKKVAKKATVKQSPLLEEPPPQLSCQASRESVEEQPPTRSHKLKCFRCSGTGYFIGEFRIKSKCKQCFGSGFVVDPDVEPKIVKLEPSVAGIKESKTASEVIQIEPVLDVDPAQVPYFDPPAMPEKPKEKPKAILSLETLRERFRLKCQKNSRGHWHYAGWKNGVPNFIINGVSYTVRRAAWLLYKGTIPKGMDPIAKCGIFNCVAPDCLIPIPQELIKHKPSPEQIREIRRLNELGKTADEILEIMGLKVTPRVVGLVVDDLKYWGVK